MIQLKKHRVAAFILAFVMALSLGACAGRPEANPDAALSSSGAGDVSGPDTDNGGRLIFANPLPIPTQAAKGFVVDTGFLEKAKEKHAINSDTVGWLQIPNTKIDDVIVFYPGDRNSYYLRRDFNKVPNTGPLAGQYGSYFADYRSKFEGGGQGLSRNTVIYGHSMEDNPDGGGFSQLKKYLDEDFARKNPYVYFSTLDEDMAWEVFAVFYTTINFAYNRPDPK
ncbi:MAG: class B sortase, partial [Oscillospiraceae bacterium]|nr:class B sortase [Oscillospiraceae bacterium]